VCAPSIVFVNSEVKRDFVFLCLHAATAYKFPNRPPVSHPDRRMVGVIRGKTVSGADILDLLSCPIPIHFHPAPLYYDCPTRRTHRIDVSKLTRADRDALALALERSTSKITGTCATDDELLEDIDDELLATEVARIPHPSQSRRGQKLVMPIMVPFKNIVNLESMQRKLSLRHHPWLRQAVDEFWHCALRSQRYYTSQSSAGENEQPTNFLSHDGFELMLSKIRCAMTVPAQGTQTAQATDASDDAWAVLPTTKDFVPKDRFCEGLVDLARAEVPSHIAATEYADACADWLIWLYEHISEEREMVWRQSEASLPTRARCDAQVGAKFGGVTAVVARLVVWREVVLPNDALSAGLRGRMQLHDEEAAATKLQAISRGRSDRALVDQLKEVEAAVARGELAAAAEAAEDEAAAAAAAAAEAEREAAKRIERAREQQAAAAAAKAAAAEAAEAAAPAAAEREAAKRTERAKEQQAAAAAAAAARRLKMTLKMAYLGSSLLKVTEWKPPNRRSRSDSDDEQLSAQERTAMLGMTMSDAARSAYLEMTNEDDRRTFLAMSDAARAAFLAMSDEQRRAFMAMSDDERRRALKAAVDAAAKATNKARCAMGASDYAPTSVWHNHPPPNSRLRRTESTEVTSWPTPTRSGASHFRAGTAPESHHPSSVGRIAIGRTPVKPLRPITAPQTCLAADVYEAFPTLSAWSSTPATPLTGLMMSPGQLGRMSSLPTSPQPHFPAPAGGRQRASLQASALASARASACASRLSSRPSVRASAATTPNIGAARANFGAAFVGVGHDNLADSSPLEHASLMQWLDLPPRVPPPSREHGYRLSHRLASPASMPQLTVRVGGGWGVDVKPVLLGSSVLPAARLRPVHSPILLSTVPTTCFGSVPTSLDALGGMGLADHEVAELNMQNTPFKSRPVNMQQSAREGRLSIW